MEVRRHPQFEKWFRRLKDGRASARILLRIERFEDGNFGDHKPVGDGVQEMRIDYGPGYRVYYVQRGSVLVVLLCGGDKSTQSKDIVMARRLAQDLKDWPDDLN